MPALSAKKSMWSTEEARAAAREARKGARGDEDAAQDAVLRMLERGAAPMQAKGFGKNVRREVGNREARRGARAPMAEFDDDTHRAETDAPTEATLFDTALERIEAKWPDLSARQQRTIVKRWARARFEQETGTAWKPGWTKRYARVGHPPGHRAVGSRALQPRAYLVSILDWRNVLGLTSPAHRRAGALGSRDRFMKAIEFTFFSLGCGLWPTRHKRGPRAVIQAEHANMAKVLARYGQKPLPMYEPDGSPIEKRERSKRNPDPSTEFASYRIPRGKRVR